MMMMMIKENIIQQPSIGILQKEYSSSSRRKRLQEEVVIVEKKKKKKKKKKIQNSSSIFIIYLIFFFLLCIFVSISLAKVQHEQEQEQEQEHELLYGPPETFIKVNVIPPSSAKDESPYEYKLFFINPSYNNHTNTNTNNHSHNLFSTNHPNREPSEFQFIVFFENGILRTINDIDNDGMGRLNTFGLCPGRQHKAVLYIVDKKEIPVNIRQRVRPDTSNTSMINYPYSFSYHSQFMIQIDHHNNNNNNNNHHHHCKNMQADTITNTFCLCDLNQRQEDALYQETLRFSYNFFIESIDLDLRIRLHEDELKSDDLAQIIKGMVQQLVEHYPDVDSHFTEESMYNIIYDQRLKKELNMMKVKKQVDEIVQNQQKNQNNNDKLKIILGAYDTHLPGWISTNVDVLDIRYMESYKRIFGENVKLDAILAEHVWEHLTFEEGYKAFQHAYDMLKPGGRLRLAVPDAAYYMTKEIYHDCYRNQLQCMLDAPSLMNMVPKFALHTDIVDEHKVQYTHIALKMLLSRVGFDVTFKEFNTVNGSSMVQDDMLKAFDKLIEEDHNNWGRINRSVQGKDVRGVFSIYIDAIKVPSSNEISSDGSGSGGDGKDPHRVQKYHIDSGLLKRIRQLRNHVVEPILDKSDVEMFIAEAAVRAYQDVGYKYFLELSLPQLLSYLESYNYYEFDKNELNDYGAYLKLGIIDKISRFESLKYDANYLLKELWLSGVNTVGRHSFKKFCITTDDKYVRDTCLSIFTADGKLSTLESEDTVDSIAYMAALLCNKLNQPMAAFRLYRNLFFKYPLDTSKLNNFVQLQRALGEKTSIDVVKNPCDAWAIQTPVPDQIFNVKEHVDIFINLESLDPEAFNIRRKLVEIEEWGFSTPNPIKDDIWGFQECISIKSETDNNDFKMYVCNQKKVWITRPGCYILTAQLYQFPSYDAVCPTRNVRFCVEDQSDFDKEKFVPFAESKKEQKINVEGKKDLEVDGKMQILKKSITENTYSKDLPYKTAKRYIPDSLEKVCFFTMVLNGMPFLPYQIKTLQRFGSLLQEKLLQFNIYEDYLWDWHIVEGVANGRANQRDPYSKKPIDERFQRNHLSVDGTTEYLDGLSQAFPNVHLYRKCNNPSSDPTCAWNDKIEMANTVNRAITKSCLMVEIDVDELWTPEQLVEMYMMFYLVDPNENKIHKQCAYFNSHFFVGRDLVTDTLNGYGHSNDYEWLRAWRFDPGMVWYLHAPPLLIAADTSDGSWRGLTGKECFSHEETYNRGLVFTHYAYALESQVDFKGSFYGYGDIVEQWKKMQNAPHPVKVSDYLPWLRTEDRLLYTMASSFEKRKLYKKVDIVPFPTYTKEDLSFPISHKTGNNKIFHENTPGQFAVQCEIRVVVDGLMFQMQSLRPKGISRVWLSVLPVMLKTLARNNGCMMMLWRSLDSYVDITRELKESEKTELLPFLEHRVIPSYIEDRFKLDESIMLSSICREVEAHLFVSTYFSFPIKKLLNQKIQTKSSMILHDLLPEKFNWDMEMAEWRKKVEAINEIDNLIAISKSTAIDFEHHYVKQNNNSQVAKKIHVSRNGIDTNLFKRASENEIEIFKTKYDIPENYIIIVGARGGYKNTHILYSVLSKWETDNNPPFLLIIGGDDIRFEEQKTLQGFQQYKHIPYVSNEDLVAAYSGANSLVYISVGEGFGLPAAEAMSCGCPVIICKAHALFETTGMDAFVDTAQAIITDTPIVAQEKGICAISRNANQLRLCLDYFSMLSVQDRERSQRHLIKYVNDHLASWVPLSNAILSPLSLDNFNSM